MFLTSLPIDTYLQICSYLSSNDLARLCCVDRLSKRVAESYIQRQLGVNQFVTLYYYFWELFARETNIDCSDAELELILHRYLLLASQFPSDLQGWWKHLEWLTDAGIEQLVSVYLTDFGDQEPLLDWLAKSFGEEPIGCLEIFNEQFISFRRMLTQFNTYTCEPGPFQYLRSLDLINLSLTEVPDLRYFSNLHSLNLAENQLITIPQWCWNIKELILDNNPLQFPNYCLEEAYSLVSLSMENCGLTQLDWLWQPKHPFFVEYLNVSSNQLTKVLFTAYFGAYSLNLMENRITLFAGELTCKSIFLCSNDLEYIRVRSVERLELQANPRLQCWSVDTVKELNLQGIGQQELTLAEIKDRTSIIAITIGRNQVLYYSPATVNIAE